MIVGRFGSGGFQDRQEMMVMLEIPVKISPASQGGRACSHVANIARVCFWGIVMRPRTRVAASCWFGGGSMWPVFGAIAEWLTELCGLGS